MAPQAVAPGSSGGEGGVGTVGSRLRSAGGILRLLQLLLGAAVWVTVAANRYQGSAHFALLVAVLFWLLTLGALLVAVLGKQELVPLLGGSRWPTSNLVLDVLATLLYVPAAGILGYQARELNYCNLEHYAHTCLYRAFLAAATCAALTAATYLISALYRLALKCRGHTPLV